MRFFSGGRDLGAKKNKASDLYKKKLYGKVQAEKTADEKYREVLDARLQKMMEEAVLGRKKQIKMLGMKSPTVDEKPKELSKSAKLMMRMLAMQKMRKEAKMEKKKIREHMWAEKAKKREANMAKAAQEALEYQEKLAAEEAAAAALAAAAAYYEAQQATYSPAGSDDNSGW